MAGAIKEAGFAVESAFGNTPRDAPLAKRARGRKRLDINGGRTGLLSAPVRNPLPIGRKPGAGLPPSTAVSPPNLLDLLDIRQIGCAGWMRIRDHWLPRRRYTRLQICKPIQNDMYLGNRRSSAVGLSLFDCCDKPAGTRNVVRARLQAVSRTE